MSQQAPGGPPFRPRWTQELLHLHLGRVARQFVLHFNITDLIVELDNQQPATELGPREFVPCGNIYGLPRFFREFLYDFLFTSRLHCQAIYTYSLAAGLDVVEPQESQQLSSGQARPDAWQRLYEAWAQVKTQKEKGKETDLPDKVSDNLKLLGHLLRQRHTLQVDSRHVEESELPIAVILDYAEKLIPYRLGEGHGDREQLQALEMVQRWALDPHVRDTQNIVILLTTNIGQIPPSVFASGSGCREIRVPLPGQVEREAFIRWRISNKQFPAIPADQFPSTPELQIRGMARATQGMRLSDIDNLNRRIYVEGWIRQIAPIIEERDVQREKALVIQAQSEGLLEVLQPRRGFNEIGGMKKLKAYLNMRTRQMSQGQHTPLVPSGLLLAGPPGTGKTIIAEALARESGFNLVKMRSIQDKWVGSSERNLELVINLLKDLYPVVVFVDEIDQAIGRRDTGQHGDSGVSARMFARILEEMSNPTNRGKILWVAATNRVDLLDDALLRRFDRVIPLLVPDVEEACRIFATMPATIRRQSDDAVNVAYSGDLAQSGREIDGRPEPTEQDLNCFLAMAEEIVKRGLTGAGIEIIVRRAAEIACEELVEQGERLNETNLPGIRSTHLLKAIQDFKPNHDRNSYDYQSLMALRGCNFHSVMPDLPDHPIFQRIRGADGQIDPRLLEEEARRLRGYGS